MTPVQLSAIISVAGVFCSVVVSAFIAGIGWGSIKRDVQTLSKELAEVKGMFVLRLRDDLTHKE